MPMTSKELHEWYLITPYFRNIYLHLAQHKLPSLKAAIRQVDKEAERFLLLHSLLFGKQNLHDELNLVLCSPTSCLDHILDVYHN